MPEMDAVITTAPSSLARSAGTAARRPRIVPRRFTAKTRSTTSMACDSSGPAVPIPALSTRPSTAPKRSIARATIAALPSSVLTSAANDSASSPRSPTQASRSSSRSTPSTDQPSACSLVIAARPMPEAAPVTTAAGIRQT